MTHPLTCLSPRSPPPLLVELNVNKTIPLPLSKAADIHLEYASHRIWANILCSQKFEFQFDFEYLKQLD